MTIDNHFFHKIIDRLNGQARSITSAAFILSTTSILSGILGLLRDRLLASNFGAGDDLDAYYAAFRLPDLVYVLLIFGALSGGVIPVFTSHLKKKDNSDIHEADKDTWIFANNLLNVFLLFFLLACAVIYIFAPGLVILLTPGFPPDKMILTTKLTRLFLLGTFILGASGFLSSFLQSLKRFFIFAWAGVIYNLGIILGIIFLAPTLGIFGVAWGVVLGTILHLTIQLLSLVNSGYRYRPIFNLLDKDLLKVLKLMIPRSISLGISQLNYVALTVIASGLTAGSLAIFNFSSNLITLPIGIFGASFATAAFPALCEAFHEKNWHKFKEGFSAAFRQLVFLTLPLAILLFILREQIVQLVFSVGKFDLSAVNLTIQTLSFFTIALLFDSLILLLIRAFLALEDSLTPALAIFCGSLIRIVSALIFSQSLGVSGLALGYSIGSLVNVLLLIIFLEIQSRKYLADLHEKQIIFSTAKIFISSICAGVSSYFVLQLLDNFLKAQTMLNALIEGLTAGLAGIAVYLLLGLCLRSQEIKIFWYSLSGCLPIRKTMPEQLEPVEKRGV